MISLMLGLAAAAAQPSVAVTVDPKHLLVEGVATDGTTIWVSSILDRQILACTKSCRTIATLPEGLHPFGLAWDWSRQVLWVAADCPPGVPGIKECERGALLALSRTGKVRGRFAPQSGSFHPGDVSTSRSGVFASDSQCGLVWGLMPGRAGLRAVNRPGEGESAQGTALAPDGLSLIVADYPNGIGSIDLKTTATTWLPRQDGKPSAGIDGLARCGGTYFGVYNGGAAPARIYTFRLRHGGVDRAELVEGLYLTDPTQLAFDGKKLLVVTDSGWEAVGKGAKSRSSGAKILAFRIGKDCRAE